MKILIVNDNGIEIGGVETYLINLKQELINKGHNVKILASRTDKRISFNDYSFKGLDISSKFRVFPYVFNLSSYFNIKKIIKEYKPDVVHLNFIFYHTSPSILLALRKIPTLMTLHAHELLAPVGINYTDKCKHPFIGYCIRCTGKTKYIPEIIKRIIFKILSRNIDMYIAPSKFYKSLYFNFGFKNIVQIYNGIRVNKNYKKVSLNNNILYVGRLAPEKGTENLINAIYHLKDVIPNLKLKIVGDGPEYDRLSRLIGRYNLNSIIKLVGKVPNNKLSKFYNECSIVIVPSAYPDNLPTVCIEAMNYGRSIIASNIGGLPELISKNGVLVEPNNSIDLAKAIKKLLLNKRLLSKYSKQSRVMINKFNIDSNVVKILNLYQKLSNNYITNS